MAGSGNVETAFAEAFHSPNVLDSNMEAANVVDVLNYIALAGKRIAYAITADAARATDATDGSVESLTESVMGMTAGLCKIAESIDNLADAVREHSPPAGAQPE